LAAGTTKLQPSNNIGCSSRSANWNQLSNIFYRDPGT
jgi:hypothetical protein